MSFETPVLLIIFNRPHTTRAVFEVVRKVKPKYLYVAADGPRLSIQGELDRVMRARDILSQVDWPCEIKTLFREKNLGCKKAVSEAITWFFNHVNQGIILEDDCLPSITFFNYCEELLNKYKDDYRVWHIGGTNVEKVSHDVNASYYFSFANNIWGWATWKRTWDQYDVNMSDYKSVRVELLEALPDNMKYYINLFDGALDKKLDTWDYQYNYLMIKNSYLSIVPKYNLISNIGFSDDATHTKNTNSYYSKMPTYDLNEIIHPKSYTLNLNKYQAQINKANEKSGLFMRVLRKLSRVIF